MADPSDQLEDARAFALAYCVDRGDRGAAERLRIDLAGHRVVFSTIDAERCGSSISGFLKPERQELTIATALSRILRQRARDRAIAAAGETGSPAWSMDIHALAWTMLCNAGVNPLLLAGLERMPTDDRVTGFREAVSRSPIFVTPEIRAGRIFTPTIGISAGSGMNDGLFFYESGALEGPPRLHIRDVSAPQTMVAALGGRPLHEIVEHPLLKTTGDIVGKIMSLRTSGDGDTLTIDLPDDRRTLAPPPSGIDPVWLKFPWNP